MTDMEMEMGMDVRTSSHLTECLLVSRSQSSDSVSVSDLDFNSGLTGRVFPITTRRRASMAVTKTSQMPSSQSRKVENRSEGRNTRRRRPSTFNCTDALHLHCSHTPPPRPVSCHHTCEQKFPPSPFCRPPSLKSPTATNTAASNSTTTATEAHRNVFVDCSPAHRPGRSSGPEENVLQPQLESSSSSLSSPPPCKYVSLVPFILLHVLLFTASWIPLAAAKPNMGNVVTRATTRDDVIGYYTMHPGSHLVADNSSCPLTLSVETYWFRASRSTSLVSSPDMFSMLIPYEQTTADNYPCAAGGEIPAVEFDHPFVTNGEEVIHSWASGGDSSNPPFAWLTVGQRSPRNISNVPFIKAIKEASWVVGYDFTERTCLATRIPAPVAYLWFQPTREVNLAALVLTPADKLLVMAFGGSLSSRACIYVAQRVGGQEPYGPGPNADDTNPNSTFAPRPDPSYRPNISPPPGASPAPGLATESPSVSPSLSTSPSPSGADLEDASDGAPSVTPPVFGGPVQNDANGPLGGAAGGSSRTSCFPATSRVTLSDGTYIPLSSLRTGHSVRISSDSSYGTVQTSPVFFFSHRIRDGDFVFLNITVGTDRVASLIVSPDHYVHVSGNVLVAARDVKPHVHSLVLADGAKVKVSSIATVVGRGLFAPHTFHGDIIVDGFVVSTYTRAVHPRFAHHVLLAPVRLLYRLGLVPWVQPWFDRGAPLLASFMPSGPSSLRRFT